MSKPHLILLLAGVLGLALTLLARRRAVASRKSVARAEAWPAFVDSVSSSLLAGLTIHESLESAALLAQPPLVNALQQFRQDLSRQPVARCLDGLASHVSIGACDEFSVLVKLNLKLGGSGLVKLLQQHASRVRDQNAVQAKLRTKVTATLAMAKISVVAPWVLLALLVARPETAGAFDSSEGMAILLFGLAVCVLAFRLIGALGKPPLVRRIYAPH